MRIDPAEHRAQPWRVHTLAPDFELLDVWRFALAEPDLDAVLAKFWTVFAGMARDSWLARTRLRVGRMMRWDDHDFSRPIPGCTEKSVGERLTAADRAASRAGTDAPSPIDSPVVRTVYVFANDALYEASNDTIHLMLHVGIVGSTATLAVYIKSRGVFSRVYMAAITPARHWIVYPAFTRKLEAAWANR